MNVVVVTVTYGNRFTYLLQVIESVVLDPLVSKVIVVDNGSYNEKEIQDQKHKYGTKLHIIRLSKNAGSAVGFARGLEYARTTEATHVLLLDDDNVPEKGAIKNFSDTLDQCENKNVVLNGSRSNLVGSDTNFLVGINKKPLFTFFDIFSRYKINYFLKKFFIKRKLHVDHNKKIRTTDSFAYGGALIPILAVRSVPLPDESLVLYGDDIEYSWNIKKLGYEIYQCESPYIHDVDLTFGQESHIMGLFDAKTKPFKVFYRIRNMVYLSLKHSLQSRVELYLSMICWFIGLGLVVVIKKGLNKNYFKRVYLIAQAVYAGFYPQKPIPEGVVLP